MHVTIELYMRYSKKSTASSLDCLATNQMCLQDLASPFPKLGAFLRINTVANGYNGIKVEHPQCKMSMKKGCLVQNIGVMIYSVDSEMRSWVAGT